ncbi:MAG: aldolase/citrate lyase family protein [Verrucomicrobiota bacterium]
MASKKSAASASQWENPVKVKLKKGEPVIGIVISVNSVEVAAQAASMGFDFLWLEMEHTPISLETVRNVVLATRGLPAVPIARPPVNELWTAKRLLDCGVLGVIFPFTSTPELAKRAADACHYPPMGLRGSGADLAHFRWPAPNYYDFADKNVLVVAVVEDTTALSHIDEIAATPGIDVIFIGTSDLSFSLGLRGEQNHPKLDAAVARIVAAGKKHGKALGRPALTVEQINKFKKQGFLFFMSATDTEFMARGAAQLLEPFGKSQRTLSTVGL